jgi:hypothetical protein
MKIVYIASPYSIGDQEKNVRAQIDAASELIDTGYCPYAPLLDHFIHRVYPKPYETWLRCDMEMLGVADIILRLPGESSGADREIKEAERLGKKIIYRLKDLK